MDASKHSSEQACGKSLQDSSLSLLLPVLVTATLVSLSITAAHAEPRHVPGRVIVKPRAQIPDAYVSEKLRRRGAASIRSFDKSSIRVVDVRDDAVESLIAALNQDPDIEFAERDYVAQTTYVPNDPLVLSRSAWHLSKIQAQPAWDFTRGSSNIIIAVLDSGVMANHGDLSGQILPGYDFVNGDADASDDFGHGTAVAGTIVATGNNALGTAGVAFGCRVLPVKVVDASGFGSYSAIAQGIRYAVNQGARIINLSIAGTAASATLQDAVDYAWAHNVVVVASSGNDGTSIPQFPAACRNVVAVSAISAQDTLSSFSSFGPHISLCAPGEDIWTTQRSPASPFGSWRGTSFASPVVAAAAALVAAENPTLSNQRITSILFQSADEMGEAGRDAQFGFGRVNAYAAVLLASQEPGAVSSPQEPDGTTNEPPIEVDKIAPTLMVQQAPKNNSRLINSTVTLTGIANDDITLGRVVVTVNGVPQLANGTGTWTSIVSLSAGPNSVRIQSVDAAGNMSSAVTYNWTLVVLAPVSVMTSGAGNVLPNLNGKLLEIGKSYTVRAMPAAGQAFAEWIEPRSSSQMLTFTMRSNLTLTASFVPSPFPAVKGSYMGLIGDTNGVAPASAGLFNITVTAGGQFTGKLQLGAARHSVRGQLNLDGASTIKVVRKTGPPLTLQLQFDLKGASDQLSGTLSDGAWTSQLEGDRNVYSAKINPAPQAGSRSFFLKRTDDSLTVGNGTSVIKSSGTIRIKGKLGDGRPFSAGSMLARNGDSPLFIPLSNGSETVIGWLNFPAQSNTAANGTVAWVRVGTNAFAAMLEATAISSE